MSVSDKIKAGLKLNGKQIQSLAEYLNISKQSMTNKLYRDSFSAEDLIKIADFLNGSLTLSTGGQNIIFGMDDIREDTDTERR